MLRDWPAGPLLRAAWTLPWDVALRVVVPPPRAIQPGHLDGVGPLPVLEEGDAGGSTWLPAVGPVRWDVPARWSADPRSGHDFAGIRRARGADAAGAPGSELLRCLSRARLTEVWHAALLARAGGPEAAFAAEFAGACARSFGAANPPGSSPHWLTAMEAGLRAVRLLHAASALREAALAGGPGASASREALPELLSVLAAHEAWLDARCDWRGPFTGNHQLVASGARAVLACALRPRRAPARRALGAFWREMARQVLPDGAHFESSTAYHLLAAETSAQVALAARAAGEGIPLRARARLDALLAATAALARPDGTVAAVGDADETRFLDWPPSPRVPREGEARVALALLRSALGDTAARGPTPRAAPALLPDGGFAVLGGEAGGDGLPLHLTVSFTDEGRDGTGGHAHDDTGAYDFWAGEPVVVFRGTRCYFEDAGLRESFRGAAAASLLQVDGLGLGAPRAGTPFRRRSWARPALVEVGFESLGRVALGHHAFARAPGRPLVLRRLALQPGGALEVEDVVTGAGEHDLVLRVHWAPGAAAEPRADGAVATLPSGRFARLLVEANDAAGRPVALEAGVERVRHSARFGEDSPAHASVVRLRAPLPVTVRHAIRVT